MAVSGDKPRAVTEAQARAHHRTGSPISPIHVINAYGLAMC